MKGHNSRWKNKSKISRVVKMMKVMLDKKVLNLVSAYAPKGRISVRYGCSNTRNIKDWGYKKWSSY